MAALRSLMILAVAGTASFTHAQCEGGNLLVNGSFTGTEGQYEIASGWVGISTPDLNDEIGDVNTSSGYAWVDTPVASPSGGTWQNLTGTEGVAQGVTTEVGQLYRLCVEHAQTGIASSSLNYDNPFALVIMVEEDPVLQTPMEATSFVWQTSCVEFIATTTFTEIRFNGYGTQTYGAVDGACLTLLSTGIHGEHPAIPFTVYPDPVVRGAALFTSVPMVGLQAVDALGHVLPLPTNGLTVDITALPTGAYYLEGRTAQNRRMYARLLVTSE